MFDLANGFADDAYGQPWMLPDWRQAATLGEQA
jgi:hypothetical protein